MKDLCQYGNRPEDEWEILPWIPDPRPPFKIWAKPEQIAPFFLIPHHPYAISLLLKISDGFRTEEFRRLGLIGSSEASRLHVVHLSSASADFGRFRNFKAIKIPENESFPGFSYIRSICSVFEKSDRI